MLLIPNHVLFSFLPTRLAEEKKEEGNQLYKLKSYRDALAKYSEAIGKFILQLDTSMWNKISKFTGEKTWMNTFVLCCLLFLALSTTNRVKVVLV